MKPKASRSKTILTTLVAVVILALLVVAAVSYTHLTLPTTSRV